MADARQRDQRSASGAARRCRCASSDEQLKRAAQGARATAAGTSSRPRTGTCALDLDAGRLRARRGRRAPRRLRRLGRAGRDGQRPRPGRLRGSLRTGRAYARTPRRAVRALLRPRRARGDLAGASAPPARRSTQPRRARWRAGDASVGGAYVAEHGDQARGAPAPPRARRAAAADRHADAACPSPAPTPRPRSPPRAPTRQLLPAAPALRAWPRAWRWSRLYLGVH